MILLFIETVVGKRTEIAFGIATSEWYFKIYKYYYIISTIVT